MGGLADMHVGPEPPLHCRGCSRRMKIYWFKPMLDKKYMLYAECSKPWWVGILGFHDKAIQDEKGDWLYI